MMNLELHPSEMSDEEYVKLVKDRGLRIVRHGGMFWREVAPFFWRPVFHFLSFDDRRVRGPWSFRLGAYQFPVLEGRRANSSICYYIFGNPREYGIHSLSRNKRQELAHAMNTLEVRIEADLPGFVERSYPVYISFAGRSDYGYRRDRVARDVFADWARRLFDSRKAIVLGAYRDNVMVGVLTMVFVRNVAVLLSHFTHTDHLKSKASDILYHAARSIASRKEGLRFVYAGMWSENKGVNEFKELRGATLIKAPAFVYMNPVASRVLEHFGKKYHRKILGAL